MSLGNHNKQSYCDRLQIYTRGHELFMQFYCLADGCFPIVLDSFNTFCFIEGNQSVNMYS